MFPRTFNGRVAERMAVWCGLLAFLLLLYGGAEAIQAARTAQILDDRRAATAALLAQVDAGLDKRTEEARAAARRIRSLDDRQAALSASHRQNKLLIGMLALFLVAQIFVLEYRWTFAPIARMATILNHSGRSWHDLAPLALRRDEIGVFARALIEHSRLVESQQVLASQQQSEMQERLARQETFRRESMAFQARIADIVQRLEGHAGRMSAASGNLLTISSEADARAAASAQSTERVSGHVDAVATSIRDISATLADVVGDAQRTSEVAASARSLVAAASSDVAALTDAARAIEPVIELIEDVANQTNLLALNATIEAARAGEMGRGFGVVAQEVKQLATRTARATEEVRTGLHGIAMASDRIVERVNKLVDSIEQVDAVAATIAGSMRRQDSNSQAITSNTTKAAEDVREVAASVRDVAAMIAQARQAADLVTKASDDLGQQAADLKGAVVRFIETTERIAA